MASARGIVGVAQFEPGDRNVGVAQPSDSKRRAVPSCRNRRGLEDGKFAPRGQTALFEFRALDVSRHRVGNLDLVFAQPGWERFWVEN